MTTAPTAPEAADRPPVAPSSTSRPKPGRGRHRLFTIGAIAAALVAGLLVARFAVNFFQPHLYSGTVLRQSTPAPDMDGLTFASGEPVDLDALRGDVVLVYFGYTNCPDVCPLTLSTAAQARSQLSEDRAVKTHVLMVSVDPARDQLGPLQDYVASFDSSFRGVGGEQADIDRTASLYGVFYELGEGTVEEGYVVDHTATLLGIAPDGTLRVVWSSEVTADDLTADIDELFS